MQLSTQSKRIISNLFAATQPRPQTPGEERANSLSHALGLAAALTAAGLLMATAAARGDGVFLAAVCVYAASGVGLYLASTLYHALPAGRAKDVLLVADHSAIFVFIAGTYTPFIFNVIAAPWDLYLIIAIWSETRSIHVTAT